MTAATKPTVQSFEERFPGTKNLGIKIAATSHMKLKFFAFMEGMSQSAMIEKMIAEYVPPNSQPDPDAHQRFIERLREEGWLPPNKDEATK